jgi:ABC-type Co2+ transport system permease subunit
MAGFLSAHGYEPGPTQRPLLAGAISGVLATAPAIVTLKLFGSLRVEAEILGRSELATVAAGCLLMAFAGALYGRLFGRAANDVRGGWLFGMAFGFALWAAGAVMILPLASGGRAPAGEAAMGLFLSLVAWGAALGLIHPFVHRPLHQSIETASRRTDVGPSAAASRQERGPRRDLKPPQEAPLDRPRS